jgi:hypothetical protein
MSVDWTGATLPVYGRYFGLTCPASLFVAALGASSYLSPPYAPAAPQPRNRSWIAAKSDTFSGTHYTSRISNRESVLSQIRIADILHWGSNVRALWARGHPNRF